MELSIAILVRFVSASMSSSHRSYLVAVPVTEGDIFTINSTLADRPPNRGVKANCYSRADDGCDDLVTPHTESPT